jgi:hypothetical protein
MSLLKNRPKCGKTIFVNINVYHGKNSPRIWATFVFLKTGQKQSPYRQKFAQSGHPECLSGNA